MAKRFGEVKLFIASVVGFVLLSWLCGIAPNLQALVIFRVLQGFVARTVDSAVAKFVNGIVSS